VLVICHGLTGGSQEGYVQHAALAAARVAGVAPLVFNARGCGGSALTSPRTFCAAETGDLSAATAYARQVVGPDALLFHAGFSLGAGILAKWVGETGSACDSAGAVVVAASWDFALSERAMDAAPGGCTPACWRPRFSPIIAGALRRYWRRHAAVLMAGGVIHAEAAACARTAREFDAAVICPQFGYSSPDHYYAEASAGRLLHAVRVPMLVLNAADDPICAVGGLLDKAREVQRNAAVCAVITPSGGHLGWAVGAAMPTHDAWHDAALAEFLAHRISVEREQGSRGMAWDLFDSTYAATGAPLPIDRGGASLTPEQAVASALGRIGRI